MKKLLSPIGAKLVRSFLLFAFSFFLVNNVSGQATVTTDKPDYAPLSNAVFTGSGFLPGETVVLKVKNLTQACNTVSADSSYLPWTVKADAEGNFVTAWIVCDCPGDSLRLKATGQTSGQIAYVYFSDAPNDYTISVLPTTLCPNKTVTLTFTVNITGSNESCFQLSIPTGYTSASATFVSATGGKIWNPSISGSTINVSANSNADRLSIPSTLVFTVQVTTPASGTDTWTTVLRGNTSCGGSSTAPLSPGSPVTTVQDNIAPAAPTLATVTGQCSASVGTPTTTDNCAGTINGTTSDPTSYSTQGTFTVHWSFNDGNGNIRTANQTVIVDDVTPPAVPTLSTVTGQCSASVSTPTTTDNCAGTINGTTSDPTSYSTQGTFTVHWSFNDGNGNIRTANQTVIVDDVTPPAVPTLATVTGQCLVAIASRPTTTDNCAGLIFGTTSDPTVFVGEGTFTVHWSFDDGNGNTTTANQTVIVDDITPPAVPSLATVTGECAANVVEIAITLDNCSGWLNGTTSDPLSYSTQGTFTIHWSFDDGNGNTTTANQTVIVDDVTPPAVPTLATVTGQCSASLSTPTTTDNCAGTINGTTSDPTSYSTQGTFTVHWSFNDGNGNIRTANQTVIVNDVTPPTISAAGANTTINCPAVPSFTPPTATDACDASPSIVEVSDVTTFSSLCAGNYIRTKTWKAKDITGNESGTVSQSITVKDLTAPVLTGTIPSGISGINFCVEPGGPTIDEIAAQYTDACGGLITVVKTGTPTGGVCGWSVTYHYTIADQCGNYATPVDITYSGGNQTAPELTGVIPSGGTGINACSAPAGPSEADIAGQYTGFCGGAITVVKTGTPTGGVCGWSVTYHYTIRDQCNNFATAVDITYSGSDQTAPVLTGSLPSGGTAINACSAPTGPSEADIAALYTDACGGAITVVKTGAPSPFGVYGWTVTYHYTIADQCSNFATEVDITYSGSDQTAPAVPTLATVIGECAAGVGTPTTTDNCSGVINGTTSDPTSYSGEGTYTIHWSFDDGNGNTTTANQTVIVDDVTPPVPPVIATATGECSSSVTAPTAADNCAGSVTGTTSDPTSYTTQGTFIVHWTFNDGNGNISTANQTVIVDDVTPPVPPVIANATGECSASVTAPTAADNCAGSVTGTTSDPTSYATQGTFTVHWTFNDGNGNISTANQTVIVDDVTPPVPPVITNATGQCSASVTAPIASDNCVGSVTGTTGDPLTYSTQGTFTVHWTFNDGNGNISTANQTVIVADVAAPAISCPISGSVTKLTNPGLCTYTIVGAEFNATASDNCTVSTLSYQLTGATTGTGSSLAGVVLNSGSTTIKWIVTDGGGNTISCSFNVLVVDDQNSTGYIVYATKKIKFEEYNFIRGNVGLTSLTEKAEFKKNDVLDPYFVKAGDIKVDLPSTVNNKIYTPANDGPSPTFYPYNGSTVGLSDVEVSINNTVLNGNWKDVKIKKGITATINGDNFGKIHVEEGANVTFTASSINMVSLEIHHGKKGVNTTNVTFSNPASVKVKEKSTVEEDCQINVNGPKVTFYMGNGTDHDVDFEVKTNNTKVTANMMIPYGKLKTDGGSGPGVMTGWYLVEELEGNGKNVTWNRYNCTNIPPPCFTPVFIVCPPNQADTAIAGECNSIVEYLVVATNEDYTSFNYNLSGATTGSGISTGSGLLFNLGTTKVTITASNACGTAICTFNVVVVDDNNGTGYVVYAKKLAKFEENNSVNGNVGVTAADGKAEFKKSTILDPFTVTAVTINADPNATVNNKINSQATGGPNPLFSPYNGNLTGLVNKEVNVNNTLLNGNWKDITVKKNITATLSGNNFGKIKLEEGANVTFTGSDINIQALEMQNGTNVVNTTINFSNPAIVRTKDNSIVGENCRVNVGGPRVTINGGNGSTSPDFVVKTKNTQVTANFIIPIGKLKTDGSTGPCIMTGLYVVETLEGAGRGVTWNGNTCVVNESLMGSYVMQSEAAEVIIKKEVFDVKVYPNPTTSQFRLEVIGGTDEKIVVELYDVLGRKLKHMEKTDGKIISFGNELVGGAYIAEVRQGKNRKSLKLIKQ